MGGSQAGYSERKVVAIRHSGGTRSLARGRPVRRPSPVVATARTGSLAGRCTSGGRPIDPLGRRRETRGREARPYGPGGVVLTKAVGLGVSRSLPSRGLVPYATRRLSGNWLAARPGLATRRDCS